MSKEFFCDKKKCVIIKVASPLFYKEGYFPIPKSLSTNTWTFITYQKIKGNSAMSFTTADNQEMISDCVRLRGSEPINYSKFSRKNRPRMMRRGHFIFEL
jgi:hypothetical protein